MSLVYSSRKPLRREIELDFIRGIAILMVLDYHMPTSILLAPFEWFGFENFGWTGVDVFFVLSGFLVGGLLVKEWQLRSHIDSKRFLVRRAFKIWPQYYFYLLAMLLTGHRTFRFLWGNFLNIQNYVGGVAHTWTFAVEEHSYLFLLALLTFAAYKRVRMRNLFLLISLLAFSVVIWRAILSAHNVNVFERTDTRIDGILYGLMLAILYHYTPELFRRIQGWTFLWVGVICLALLEFRFRPTTWWSGTLTITCADAMGVALLLLLYKHRETKKRAALYRLMAWIGLYSYGIYLWHPSVIAPLTSIARHLPIKTGAVFLAVAPPVAGILLGVLTTKLIEFPSLTLRDRFFPREVDSAVGIAAKTEKDSCIQDIQESVSVAK